MDEVKRGSERSAPKRPYEPPDVEESAQFETLALACSKTVNDYFCQSEGNTRNS